MTNSQNPKLQHQWMADFYGKTPLDSASFLSGMTKNVWQFFFRPVGSVIEGFK